MLPDKSARKSIRLKAALALLALLWLSDVAFDAFSRFGADEDCFPKAVKLVDTSGFWTATVTCTAQAAPVTEDEALPEPRRT